MFGGCKHVVILQVMAVLALEAHRCSAQLPTPSGVNFVGIGYNIISGNPEGGEQSNGGVDPGLLVNRRVFKLTYDEGKMSSDNMYRVPDEVYFIHRSSEYTSSSTTTFYGTSSYASKLSAQVQVSGSYSNLFASVEFAGSTRYERIASRTSSHGSIFFATETISNLGSARFLTELAETDNYALNKGFVADACRLPNSYNQASYMRFLDDWGTHVVIEVDIGTREGENYEEDRTEFVIYASANVAASVSAAGSYGGYSGSVAVNMDSFNSRLQSGMSFGSSFSSYAVGSDDMNEPIGIQLLGMHEVFDDSYWTLLSTYISNGRCSNSFQLSTVKSNVLEAMQGYASWKRIAASSDPQIIIPLTWPDGTYGLPKPTDGCPNSEFTWNEGWRYHDTEDSNSNNQWSNPLHLAGSWDRNNMLYNFCIKTVNIVDSNSHWAWQPGSYCIYKYGSCPTDFTEGNLYWDDEDNNNGNNAWGTLPNGAYDSNTRIYYCCRNDGVTDREIYLPTDHSFFLFPRFQHCQQVNGMKVTKEFFRWDNEDDNNNDGQSAVHPFEGLESSGHNIRIYFCYYQPE